MNFNDGASAQKENNLRRSRSEVAERAINKMVCLGDQRECPECKSIGSVVWISQDKKTMGVQCHKSHREASRPARNFGATVVRSTKTRKNVVFITAAA